MKLLYNNVDILNKVSLMVCAVLDNANSFADSISIAFNDTENEWSGWSPQPNDTLQIIFNGFDSGEHYVDEIKQEMGTCLLKALSIPTAAKELRSKSWNKVSLIQIATDIATSYGFKVLTYDVPNVVYTRVDQSDMADFSFLSERCKLEGCTVKVNNKSVIIYGEQAFEHKPPAAMKTASEIDAGFELERKANGIYKSCIVTYGNISGSYSTSSGSGVLRISDVYTDSIGEASRFAKGMLRVANKGEFSLSVMLNEIDPTLAAGTVINIHGICGNKNWFIEQIIHDIKERKTLLKLRKPLEGY